MQGQSVEKNARTAIYPGSFDPITNGHLDILSRALKIFDKIIIAVLRNGSKEPLFSVEERMSMIKQVTSGMNVVIESFDGLLADYVRQKETNIIIRSLRATSDFDYEFQMAVMNSQMNREMESIFLMTGKEYFFLSSSVVKEIASRGGDVSWLVPPVVAEKLKAKLRSSGSNNGEE
ncbi:pantetheine-phosphate adenylyltransferase [Candidatus Woesearchaeota archaeon]|nr:MAG: pantetheine-phosphate adenylyltransferase [Candidatus Woesearchaeota archaeon]